MLYGNQLENAIKDSGLKYKPLKQRKSKLKQFKCAKCNEPMIRVEGTNVMACSSCKNWYLFDNII